MNNRSKGGGPSGSEGAGLRGRRTPADNFFVSKKKKEYDLTGQSLEERSVKFEEEVLPAVQLESRICR